MFKGKKNNCPEMFNKQSTIKDFNLKLKIRVLKTLGMIWRQTTTCYITNKLFYVTGSFFMPII